MHRVLSPLRVQTRASRRGLAHFLPPPERFLSDPRLGFVCEELRSLDKLPATPPRRPEESSTPARGRSVRGVVEVSHPWPEWVQLMEHLLRKGYLDHSALRVDDASSSSSLSASKDSNLIRTACLNFARDRFDIIRYLSRRDIHIIGQCGCPSIDRKVINSGKRLRAHVRIQEGDACSSCSLRVSCKRAYVKARQDEVGRTVDVMRILLTYGLDIITGSVENSACLNKTVKESVKKLLNEIVEFSSKELDVNSLTLTSKRPLHRQSKANGHQLFKGQLSVPTKQGDWICPKCNFLNFAKNITCLRCNGQFQERFKMLQLQEERGHLPLKKGDWICLKCNFLNFAKNTECLQCHEKPHNRQLNPGEWECISCNYINFRKNTVCLRCDWKRPKAINNGDFARLEHGSQVDNKSYSFSFVRDSDIDAKKLVIQKEDLDFWRSSEDECSDFGDNRFNLWKGFNNFPIIGGRTAVSQDATVRQRWKEKMSRRHQDPSGEGVEESDHDVASATPSPMDLDNCSSEDDTAEWFGSGKLSHGFNKSSV
ncbi:Zn-finger in Ran binding protein [Musa troglodytarum]|uniref:Zn-finger in Ran binding protein n=1 Tax=Musa troglodytarum TaxID=320322 RepID=A0A9E7EN60_9LILI|nr:Zn-finger in Ran binding protein [Musa troglodytarum]